MSEPVANVVVPAANDAPDPPLEPPGEKAVFHGLRVTPHSLVQVTGAQEMIDVDQSLFGEETDRLAVDDQHFRAERLLDANAIAAQLAIGSLVRTEREERAIFMFHRRCSRIGKASFRLVPRP